MLRGFMKGVLDLSPTPTLLRANQDGGAIRGAIPEKIPIYIIVDIITIFHL